MGAGSECVGAGSEHMTHDFRCALPVYIAKSAALVFTHSILFYLCAMLLDVGDYVSPISSFL